MMRKVFMNLTLIGAFTTQLFSAISIGSLEDLVKIGTDAGFPLTGEYELTNDINAAATAEMNDGKGFIPLAVGWGNGFTGTFDGAGYTIDSLYIVSEDIDGEFIGLFGTLEQGGVVKNLSVLNAYVRGKSTVGIIAGRSKGLIENCIVSGSVQALEHNAGGIAGTTGRWEIGPKMGSIKKSISYADVTAIRYHAGGIAAWTYGGTIEECASFGSITAQVKAGGISGAGGNNCEILRSFSMAELNADTLMGGIVARSYSDDNSGIVSECWAAGRMNGKAGGGIISAGNSIVEKSYWDVLRTGVSTSSGAEPYFGLPTKQMLKEASYEGWDFASTWKIEEGKSFPSLKWMEFPSATVTYEAEDNGSITGELVQTSNALTILSKVSAEASSGYQFIRWNDLLRKESREDVGIFRDTTITAHFAAPVAISTIDELEYIGIHSDYPMDYSYYLTGDIDGRNFLFSPIGLDKPFYGSFDGKGFTISNLSIESTNDQCGLFYQLSGMSTIKSLNLDSFTVSGNGNTGSLAGSSRGTVSNIQLSNSTVNSSNSIVGGLIGLNFGSITKSVVSNVKVNGDSLVVGGFVGYHKSGDIHQSSSDAKVLGLKHVGGFAGYVVGGSITESVAHGSATTTEWVGGGFVGYSQSPSITDCYSDVSVTAINDTVKDLGGMVGLIHNGGVVQNCYYAGTFEGGIDSLKGGLFGRFLGNGNSVSSYWDTELSGVDKSSMGQGVTTAEMKTQATFQDWDFTDIWKIAADGYPTLQWEVTGSVSITSPAKSAMKQFKGSIMAHNRSVRIQLPSGVKDAKLKLFQADGRMVFNSAVRQSGVVKLPQLSAGFYIAHMSSSAASLTERVILQ